MATEKPRGNLCYNAMRLGKDGGRPERRRAIPESPGGNKLTNRRQLGLLLRLWCHEPQGSIAVRRNQAMIMVGKAAGYAKNLRYHIVVVMDRLWSVWRRMIKRKPGGRLPGNHGGDAQSQQKMEANGATDSHTFSTVEITYNIRTFMATGKHIFIFGGKKYGKIPFTVQPFLSCNNKNPRIML